MSDRRSILKEMVHRKADKITFRWRPVRKTDKTKTSLVANVGRAITEELLFYPSKVWTLTGIFREKAKIKPDVLTGIYIMITATIALAPWFIIQAMLYQLVRCVRGFWYILRGQASYESKTKKE